MKQLNKSEMTALALLAVVAVIWLAIASLNWLQCGWYGYQTKRDTRYAAFVGCMVKIDDHWVPRNELRTAQ